MSSRISRKRDVFCRRTLSKNRMKSAPSYHSSPTTREMRRGAVFAKCGQSMDWIST